MTMIGNQQRAITALGLLALEMQRLGLYTDSLFLADSVGWEFRQGTNAALRLDVWGFSWETQAGGCNHMKAYSLICPVVDTGHWLEVSVPLHMAFIK